MYGVSKIPKVLKGGNCFKDGSKKHKISSLQGFFPKQSQQNRIKSFTPFSRKQFLKLLLSTVPKWKKH